MYLLCKIGKVYLKYMKTYLDYRSSFETISKSSNSKSVSLSLLLHDPLSDSVSELVPLSESSSESSSSSAWAKESDSSETTLQVVSESSVSNSASADDSSSQGTEVNSRSNDSAKWLNLFNHIQIKIKLPLSSCWRKHMNLSNSHSFSSESLLPSFEVSLSIWSV